MEVLNQSPAAERRIFCPQLLPIESELPEQGGTCMFDSFTLFGLEFSLLDLLMAALLLGTGIYCIYTAIRVRRECGFFENKLLLPGN